MHKHSLIQKYNVPGPRYTSYPTVPFWAEEKFTEQQWINDVKEKFKIVAGGSTIGTGTATCSPNEFSNNTKYWLEQPHSVFTE